MRALAAILLLALAASGWALEDFAPGSLREAAESTLRNEGPDAVHAQLEALLENDAERIHARHVEAAKTALDLLPPLRANALAARFLDEALTRDSGARDAWQLALRLRDQIESHLDADTGVPFFTRLTELYPRHAHYRYYLADLLRDVGRSREAREQYEQILRNAPRETRALYQVAWMDETLGDVGGAIARYDQIIELRPDEIDAYRAKASLLSGILRNAEAAAHTAERGHDAAWKLPPGEARDYWVATMSRELAIIRKEAGRRQRLQLADERLTLVLKRTALAWVCALVLGLWLLRRAKLV